jgi:hypothetical protein
MGENDYEFENEISAGILAVSNSPDNAPNGVDITQSGALVCNSASTVCAVQDAEVENGHVMASKGTVSYELIFVLDIGYCSMPLRGRGYMSNPRKGFE